MTITALETPPQLDRIAALLDRLDTGIGSVCTVPGCRHLHSTDTAAEAVWIGSGTV